MSRYPTSAELKASLKPPNPALFSIFERYAGGDPYTMSFPKVAGMLKEMAFASRVFLYRVCFSSLPSYCRMGSRSIINLSTIETPYQAKADVFVALHELGHLINGPSEVEASAFAASMILAHEKRRLGEAFPNAYSIVGGKLVRN